MTYFFYYRAGLRGELWPVRSIDRPNSLTSQKYTKLGLGDNEVAERVRGRVVELEGDDEGASLYQLMNRYPPPGAAP